MHFLISQMPFGQKHKHKTGILHRFASLDCCRCVFLDAVFCQLFHLFHSIRHPFSRLRKGLFRRLPCKMMHLAVLFA